MFMEMTSRRILTSLLIELDNKLRVMNPPHKWTIFERNMLERGFWIPLTICELKKPGMAWKKFSSVVFAHCAYRPVQDTRVELWWQITGDIFDCLFRIRDSSFTVSNNISNGNDDAPQTIVGPIVPVPMAIQVSESVISARPSPWANGDSNGNETGAKYDTHHCGNE